LRKDGFRPEATHVHDAVFDRTDANVASIEKVKLNGPGGWAAVVSLEAEDAIAFGGALLATVRHHGGWRSRGGRFLMPFGAGSDGGFHKPGVQGIATDAPAGIGKLVLKALPREVEFEARDGGWVQELE